MGLQSQLQDVSSDSIPLLLVALIANCVNYLRSLLFTLLKSLGISRFNGNQVVDDGLFSAVGSGLAGLIVLADQLNINRTFSHRFVDCGGADNDLIGGGSGGSDCVVCLCTLKDGDRVRKLACRHVFHKECFDGWLDHLNFNCPLCRCPLVSDESVETTGRRVGGDLVAWFSLR